MAVNYTATEKQKEKPSLAYLSRSKKYVGVGGDFPRRPPKLPTVHKEATAAQYKELFEQKHTGVIKKEIKNDKKGKPAKSKSKQSDTSS